MPRPACVPCGRFFRPQHTGIRVLEQMPIEKSARPGFIDQHLWRPYKVWIADQWKCEGCGAVIIAGWGHSPVSENWQSDFDVWRGRTTVVVNDC